MKMAQATMKFVSERDTFVEAVRVIRSVHSSSMSSDGSFWKDGREALCYSDDTYVEIDFNNFTILARLNPGQDGIFEERIFDR